MGGRGRGCEREGRGVVSRKGTEEGGRNGARERGREGEGAGVRGRGLMALKATCHIGCHKYLLGGYLERVPTVFACL